ncbi:MAG: dNTP triphosphohydrolase [Planctomycetota bacterium]
MAWRRREDLEDSELHDLHRLAAKSRTSGGRRLPEREDPLRTAFQRDRDRVIHSAAFRRLQHKTQVMASHEGDHFRTRMTHTLEVAQMARSAAGALRLNADLCEAVALAHDLGHPPFGHAGEEALDELMQGHGGFRHNAQGVRIVDLLEDRYGHGYGLNLTASTRRSLLKGTVPASFPLSPDLVPKAPPGLEAHLVDLCDKVAYLCHDLDDGLRAGAFSLDQAAGLRLWQLGAARAQAASKHRVISEMIALLIHDLVETTATTMHGASAEGSARVRHSDTMTVLSQEVLAFLRERFYRSPRVLEAMNDGRRRIAETFAHLLHHPEDLPAHVRARIASDGRERVTCDYVAGMTDRFLLSRRA